MADKKKKQEQERVDINSLPRWGSDFKDEGAAAEAPQQATSVRFPFKPEYNSRLVLTDADKLECIECDVVVVRTNDDMDDETCPFEHVRKVCGSAFQKAAKAEAPLRANEIIVLPVTNNGIAAKFVAPSRPQLKKERKSPRPLRERTKTHHSCMHAHINGWLAATGT